jgi:hypothetical protein
MAILAVIVVLLLVITTGTSQHVRDSTRRRDASREARAGLEFLTEDLHSAVLTTNPPTLVISGGTNQETGQQLSFLVSESPEKRAPGSVGDLAAVSYFVSKAPDNSGALNLYRFHLAGNQLNEAFEKGGVENLYSTASATNKNTTELLSRNIVKFEVRHLSDLSCLFVSISAIGGDSAKIIISDPKAGQRNALLLRQGIQRYSTIIRLPPERQFSPMLTTP